MTRIVRCLVLWTSLLGGLCLWQGALATDVRVVLSDDSGYYAEVAAKIVHYLRENEPSLEVYSEVLNDATDIAPGQLVITIGTPASRWAMTQHPQTKQLSVLVTRQAWRSMSSVSPELVNKAALLMDQPAERYLRLARLLAPQGNVSAVFGPTVPDLREDFLSAARRLGIELRVAGIERGDNPMTVLNPLLEDSGVFIAVPDQADINRSLARWVLQLGFRKRVPVVGFSRSYTEAGAAAALFSAPQDVAQEASDWLADYFKGEAATLWASHMPRRFSVAVNRSVVRSLGLALPDEAEIQERIAAPFVWSESE